MAKGTVNRATILGRLGQDPDMRTTAGGTQIANLSIATTEIGAKDQSGQRQEVTEWHRAVAFGRTAEIAGQYLSKGSQVYIEGRLQTRKWTDQQGIDRYSTEIVVNEMQFIGGRGDGQGQGQQGGFQQQAPQGGFNQPKQAPQQGGFNQPQQRGFNQQPVTQPHQPGDGFDDFDDDIPF